MKKNETKIKPVKAWAALDIDSGKLDYDSSLSGGRDGQFNIFRTKKEAIRAHNGIIIPVLIIPINKRSNKGIL